MYTNKRASQSVSKWINKYINLNIFIYTCTIADEAKKGKGRKINIDKVIKIK